MSPAGPTVRVPDGELSWRFSRSSGPGGQHVNTSDTRVELMWDLEASAVLTDAQKAVVRDRLASRLTGGRLTIVSSQFRSQLRNREDAKERLEELLTTALAPRRSRRRTRPTRGSIERHRSAKQRRSETKSRRRGEWD